MKKNLQLLVLLLVVLMLPAATYAQSIYGDVNFDEEVNIADVNGVIKIILGDEGNAAAADVNGDDEVNITDVNVIIRIILGGSVGPEHAWVDLGLPSGTLWATCNVGATNPEDYGDYFAWGETAPKQRYSESNYKWFGGSWYNHSRSILKYCYDSEYGYEGFVDNKKVLDPEDDAACVNWGPAWRMPSVEQIDELTDCSAQWTQRNGVFGMLFTGPNGNTLFLPAAGYRMDDLLEDAGSTGFYWSFTLSNGASNFAYCLYFDSEDRGYSHFYRECGFTVRAVRAENQ